LFELVYAYKALGHEEKAMNSFNELTKLSRGYYQNYIEYALDYANAGLYQEATDLLNYAVNGDVTSPMVYYYLGYFAIQMGNKEQASARFKLASAADSYLCFPDRLEEISVLKLAAELVPNDAKAPYYLGNLFYDKLQYDDAIATWETSAQLDDTFPTVFRNLGIAYYNKRNDPAKALICFEKAFALDPADARVLMELDQLYKKLNYSAEARLNFVEANLETAKLRDDVYLERATLYNFLGEYQTAFEQVVQRTFHPWEGGEGKASGQYVAAFVELAKQNIRDGKYNEAIEQLTQAQTYPHNLGEGKLFGTQENDIFYWLGQAHEGLQQTEQEKGYFV